MKQSWILCYRGWVFRYQIKKVWDICFITWHKHQTRYRKINANKTHQMSVKTQVLFVKTELQLLVNHFIIILLIFFSQVINPWKNQKISNFPTMILTAYSRLTRYWARKYDSHLWSYNDWRHRGAIISSYLT